MHKIANARKLKLTRKRKANIIDFKINKYAHDIGMFQYIVTQPKSNSLIG